MKSNLNPYRFIGVLLICFTGCLDANSSEQSQLEQPLKASTIEFNYNSDNPIPSALPRIPINEETKLQESLSVEDLRKLASISKDGKWNALIKELTSFQKEIISDKKFITLEEAFAITLNENPTIKENKYDILASIWRLRAETRRWIPTIELDLDSVGYYKEQLYVNSRNPKNPNDGSGSAVSYSSNYFQAAPVASISWDAFDPERGPSIMIEKTFEERNKLLLNYSIRSLFVEVIEGYTQIEILLEEINAYSELAALEVAVADAIYEVYNNGLTSIAEVTKWRAQTYSTISQLIIYYQKLDEAYSNLSTVLGSDKYFPIQPDQRTIFLEKWPLSLAESVKKAKKENERIKSAYLDSRISKIKAQKLINSYLPTLTLTASAANYTINGVYQAPLYQSPPILPTTNQNTQNPVYQIYAGLTFDFDGGVNLARAKAEEMTARKELFRAESISNDVVETVRNSYYGLVNQTINLKATQKAIENSRISLEVYKQRFIAGLTDTTPFIQASDLYTTPIITRSTVKKNLIRDYVNLLRATASWPAKFEITFDKSVEKIMSGKD
jgi:outer membrane protein TolC